MVRTVYGRLGQGRQRTDVVEYRVDQHAAKLGDRLVAVRQALSLSLALSGERVGPIL